MEEKNQSFKFSQENEDMAAYYYNMLMSSLHVSVSKHLMDENFTVIWANDCFYESTLYTKEEYEAIFENRCSDYFKQDPEEYAKFAAAVETAVANRQPGYEALCKMPQKGGSYIWIKITGTFSDETVDGVPVIYVVFTDVTKAVEQQELQERLKEKTQQLEEKTQQLEEALKMAEEASRSKTDFLSRMSHDIRTPMNAIIGMTDIASSHLSSPDKVRDCLRKISLSSQHLLGLINDVLDMSKIENGKMTLSESEILLPEVVENIVAIMQPGIKEKQQKFDTRLLQIQHEKFYCDSLRLRQMLINILSNAQKFTPAGGTIRFEIEECPSRDPEVAWIQFTISDTGIGISPEFLEHLFDAFSRERDSRVDKTEGSGLGMAITQKVVELMGGTIDVTSRPGEGSTFVVKVPLRICPVDLTEFQFPGLKVIVVDDDDVVCEYTTQMLHEMGVEAEWENNAEAALQKITAAHQAKEDYDAVILDWQMPKMDGLEATRLIREQVGKEPSIIIISAYDWSDIEEDANAAGANGFMVKPVFMSTLCYGLQKFVLGQMPEEEVRRRTNDFGGKRILLVEDNELNREIAIEALISDGAQMEYACDGAQGVQMFEQSPEGYYDLILMDIQMPVMNGYEATKRIRTMSRKDAQTVPILALTADAFAEDVSEAKKAGMNGHLAKPLEIALLTREIAKFLKIG